MSNKGFIELPGKGSARKFKLKIVDYWEEIIKNLKPDDDERDDDDEYDEWLNEQYLDYLERTGQTEPPLPGAGAGGGEAADPPGSSFDGDDMIESYFGNC